MTKNKLLAYFMISGLLFTTSCQFFPADQRNPAQVATQRGGNGDIDSSTNQPIQSHPEINPITKTLTKPFKIKISSPNENIDFKNNSISLSVECTKTKFSFGSFAGIIDGNDKPGFGKVSCGRERFSGVRINDNSEIEVPGIPLLNDRAANNLNNLSIAICIGSLTNNPNPKSHTNFCIKAAGSDQINQLVNDTNSTIYLYRIKIPDLSVKLNGENIFHSSIFLKKRDPTVWMHIETNSCSYGDSKQICVETDLNHYSYGYVKDNSRNYLGNIYKTEIFSTPYDFILGYYGATNKITVNISMNANYNSAIDNMIKPETFAEKTITVPYNVESLQSLNNTEFNLVSRQN